VVVVVDHQILLILLVLVVVLLLITHQVAMDHQMEIPITLAEAVLLTLEEGEGETDTSDYLELVGLE
jgi:hypothetical protein